MRLPRIAVALLPALVLMANSKPPVIKNINKVNIVLPGAAIPAIVNYYTKWNLTAAGLSEDAFNSALKGYNYLLQKKILHNTSVLTVVDYSKPSSVKRLYVLDMNSGKILFKTFVAHGKNSGLEYANTFSNEEESYKTSLGFFVTNNTYNGSNGYSLKLNGCEKGINDKAAERAIVMHGAAYANEGFLQSNGYLGRSFGCPAVPEKMNKKIIDVIKNGSCLFLYHPTKKYINASKILSS
jgi:hypothetical protein